jgi:hypothetical protein
MKARLIPVTEVARNFADCVNRVFYQKQVFILIKNGVRMARLVPDAAPECRAEDLAEDWPHIALSEPEATAFAKDLLEARNTLVPPKTAWR